MAEPGEALPDALEQAIEDAFLRKPEIAVLVFPRPSDGRYPTDVTDVVGILHKSGVSVDYSADPMEAGTFDYKSDAAILPLIVIWLSQLGDLVGLINGFVALANHFLVSRPKQHLNLDIAVKDGRAYRRMKLDLTGPPKEYERVLRNALEQLTRK